MEKLNRKTDYAVFCGQKHLSLYEKTYMKNFLTILESIYTVLNRRTLSTRILDDCYEEIRKEIERYYIVWSFGIFPLINSQILLKIVLLISAILCLRGLSASNINLWRLELLLRKKLLGRSTIYSMRSSIR
jgi:hypothetical protein